jgi:hypothetical protein
MIPRLSCLAKNQAAAAELAVQCQLANKSNLQTKYLVNHEFHTVSGLMTLPAGRGLWRGTSVAFLV